MIDVAQDVLAGEEAWIVGGAIRDEALGRRLVDLDVACREPERAARAFAKRSGGAPFPLSERHGAWRVALVEGRTVDFTPLAAAIEDDLATRDFTINAIARPLGGGDAVDPFGGLVDLDEKRLRAVGPRVFTDDPLRLLRAARLEDELDFRLDDETERLVREDAALATKPSRGRIDGRLDRVDSPDYRLVAVFRDGVHRFPVSNELRRYAHSLLSAERPADDSPRSIFRFRRATEPWALDALAFVGAEELSDAVLQARVSDPDEPLLRGDELGLPPGPEIGRLLAEIEEERAAGTIVTKEEALDYARRNAGAVREDG